MWPEVFEPTQLGSFRERVHPPTTEPGDGPFVCVRFNKDWLPYVLGGLFQLVNPSSWLVSDDAALQLALERATGLLDIFGKAGDCPPMDLRFTDGCILQYSLDGGTTWLDVAGWATNFPVCNPPQTQVKFDADCLLTESFDGGETFEAVPGWAANFKDCVISNAPIIGLPPNPGDDTHDQLACSIAAYLADQVILLAMQKAVNAIQDDLTLLVFGGEVLTIIPEFVLVAAAYDAFAGIYGAVAEGTLAHYEAAIADDSLWQAVTCAIYNAIRADGYVTPGNFAAILTNIDAISYTYSDVISAIHSYVSSLGATGLAQLSQRAGLLVGAACDCGSGAWCNKWSVGTRDFCNGEWAPIRSAPHLPTCSGSVWTSHENGGGAQEVGLLLTLPFVRTMHRVRFDATAGSFKRVLLLDSAMGELLNFTGNNWDAGGGPNITGVKYIQILSQNSGSFTLYQVEIAGPTGASPFGENECTP